MLYCHCFSTFVLEYTIRKFQENQERLEFNGYINYWSMQMITLTSWAKTQVSQGKPKKLYKLAVMMLV
jgi:hypothetical protein